MLFSIAVIASLTSLAQNPAPADAAPAVAAQTAVGPRQGTLVIVGGGQVGPDIVKRFVTLAGGKDAAAVVIPTAAENDPVNVKAVAEGFSRTFGFKNVAVIHTRDRGEADSDGFVAPLKKAKAVWFNGGRQWRIVDSYLGTRTQREIEAVLERGGVIGGSSAGATIQGSYLVRGARDGNDILMAKGYEQGFGYLRGVAIDQHILPRHRTDDLVQVIGAHPELLGLGIDESTAVVAEGDRFEVIGRGVVGIYDGKDHDGKRYYYLAPGERYDLKQRRRVSSEVNESPRSGARPTPSRPTVSPAVGPAADHTPSR
jgi:cyanophycinase